MRRLSPTPGPAVPRVRYAFVDLGRRICLKACAPASFHSFGGEEHSARSVLQAHTLVFTLCIQGKALKILVIEDDLATLEFLRQELDARGHEVTAAADGREGLLLACDGGYDVMVVDRMLPSLGGMDVLRALRTSQIETPAIVLSALGGLADRVEGLRGGADDYLVKPFELDELEARLEAIGRRGGQAGAAAVLRAEAIALDRLGRRVTIDGAAVDLTSSEFAMLEMLMLNAGRPVTKAMLLEGVFDMHIHAPGPIIEPHMSRLRAKLVRQGAADPIRTLRGIGYSIAAL